MHRRNLDLASGSPLLMVTMGITPRAELAAERGIEVAAGDSLMVAHKVSDPQCLRTMIGGQA